MTVPLVVLGGGGLAREVLDVVDAVNEEAGDFEVLGFAADGYWDGEAMAERGVDYLGTVASTLERFEACYVIGIGNGQARKMIDTMASALGREAVVLVHPRATLGHRVTLGPGSVVTSGVRMTTNITAGRHVYLNLNCTVGHDCVIGDYVTVHPGAIISGKVSLEDEVTMGAGSCVIEQRTIGARSVIGAGATVVGDIPPDVTAVGTPARPLPPGT